MRKGVNDDGTFVVMVSLRHDVNNNLEFWSIDEAQNRSITSTEVNITHDGISPLPLLNFEASPSQGSPSQTCISGEAEEDCQVCIKTLSSILENEECHNAEVGQFSFNYEASPNDRLALWTIDEVGNRSNYSEIVPGNTADIAVDKILVGTFNGSSSAVKFPFAYSYSYPPVLIYSSNSYAENVTEGIGSEFYLIEFTNGVLNGSYQGEAVMDSEIPYTQTVVTINPYFGIFSSYEKTQHKMVLPYQSIELVGRRNVPDSSEIWVVNPDVESMATNFVTDSLYAEFQRSYFGSSIETGLHGRWGIYNRLNYMYGPFIGKEPWYVNGNNASINYSWTTNSVDVYGSVLEHITYGGVLDLSNLKIEIMFTPKYLCVSQNILLQATVSLEGRTLVWTMLNNTTGGGGLQESGYLTSGPNPGIIIVKAADSKIELCQDTRVITVISSTPDGEPQDKLCTNPDYWLRCGTAYRLSRDAAAWAHDHKQHLGGRDNGCCDCANAAKHAYWLCLMAKKLDPEFALMIGRAHENSQPGDPCIEKSMDLFNNEMGVKTAMEHEACMEEPYPFECCEDFVVDLLDSGRLVYMATNDTPPLISSDNCAVNPSAFD